MNLSKLLFCFFMSLGFLFSGALEAYIEHASLWDLPATSQRGKSTIICFGDCHADRALSPSCQESAQRQAETIADFVKKMEQSGTTMECLIEALPRNESINPIWLGLDRAEDLRGSLTTCTELLLQQNSAVLGCDTRAVFGLPGRLVSAFQFKKYRLLDSLYSHVSEGDPSSLSDEILMRRLFVGAGFSWGRMAQELEEQVARIKAYDDGPRLNQLYDYYLKCTQERIGGYINRLGKAWKRFDVYPCDADTKDREENFQFLRLLPLLTNRLMDVRIIHKISQNLRDNAKSGCYLVYAGHDHIDHIEDALPLLGYQKKFGMHATGDKALAHVKALCWLCDRYALRENIAEGSGAARGKRARATTLGAQPAPCKRQKLKQ